MPQLSFAEIKEFQDFLPREIFLDVLKSKMRGETYFFITESEVFKAKDKKDKQHEEDVILSETARLNNLGRFLESKKEEDTAISVYEECIELRYPALHSYERLLSIYKRKKEIENEKRILKIAVDVFTKENQRIYRQSILRNPEFEYQINNSYRNQTKLKNDDGLIIFNPYPLNKYFERLKIFENS